MTAITTAKLIAPNSAQAVAQVYEFEQDGVHLSVIAATHFLSGAGETRDNLDSLLTLRGIAKNISTSFFQTKEKGTLFALKAAIEQVVTDHTNSRIKTLVAAVAIRDSFIHFATTPEMMVVLLRNGLQHKLTKGSLTISSGSGKLTEGDTIAILSDGLKEALAASNSVDPEQLSAELHANANEGSGYAGLFIRYGSFVLPEVETILAEEQMTQAQHTPLAARPELVVPDETEIQSEEEALHSPMTAVSDVATPPQPIGGITGFPGSGFIVRSKTSEFRANKKNKRMTVVGGALLVLLLVSIVWGIKHKKVQDVTVAATEKLTEISDTLADIKASGFYNKERAQELFISIDEKIQSVPVTPQTEKNIAQIQEEIAKTREEVLGIFTEAPESFLDLTLQSASFTASSVSLSDETLRILDSSSNKVISVRIEGKRTESAGNTSDFSTVERIASYADRTFVQVGTDFFELKGQNAKLLSNLPTNSLYRLFAGNLYVVDRNENAIWRYSGNAVGFSDRVAWLAPDTAAAVSFGSARDMSIDGSIWILGENNKVTKLNQGVLQSFKLTGVNLNTVTLTHMFASEDTASLYLLDSEKGNLYVFDKTGGYQSMYTSEDLTQTVGMVISETAKKAFFVLPQKIVSLGLTHLK
ncbi:hypothetical protein KBA63_03800 [Candidatus Woesebacteria bacterium]|nr:hypothetical protein [Candidatus Woesebacteria bacterium]